MVVWSTFSRPALRLARAVRVAFRLTALPAGTGLGGLPAGEGSSPLLLGLSRRRPSPFMRISLLCPSSRLIISRVASTPREASIKVKPVRLAASLIRSDLFILRRPAKRKTRWASAVGSHHNHLIRFRLCRSDVGAAESLGYRWCFMFHSPFALDSSSACCFE